MKRLVLAFAAALTISACSPGGAVDTKDPLTALQPWNHNRAGIEKLPNGVEYYVVRKGDGKDIKAIDRALSQASKAFEGIGKVPTDVSIDEAKEGARMIILNRLAVIQDEIGSLDKVKQVVALTGFVNSEPDFYGHPQVMNGASELLVEIFGDKGKHSRTALGAAALPLNPSCLRPSSSPQS